MKIQLASDLHLEFLQRDFPGERRITPHPEADVFVLAGDIASGTQAIDLIVHWPVPVIYVADNHEGYGKDFEMLESTLRSKAVGTQVRYLERDCYDFEGVRFLGTSLWTDYALGVSAGQSVEAAMNAARTFSRDRTLSVCSWTFSRRSVLGCGSIKAYG